MKSQIHTCLVGGVRSLFLSSLGKVISVSLLVTLLQIHGAEGAWRQAGRAAKQAAEAAAEAAARQAAEAAARQAAEAAAKRAAEAAKAPIRQAHGGVFNPPPARGPAGQGPFFGQQTRGLHTTPPRPNGPTLSLGNPVSPFNSNLGNLLADWGNVVGGMCRRGAAACQGAGLRIAVLVAEVGAASSKSCGDFVLAGAKDFIFVRRVMREVWEEFGQALKEGKAREFISNLSQEIGRELKVIVKNEEQATQLGLFALGMYECGSSFYADNLERVGTVLGAPGGVASDHAGKIALATCMKATLTSKAPGSKIGALVKVGAAGVAAWKAFRALLHDESKGEAGSDAIEKVLNDLEKPELVGDQAEHSQGGQDLLHGIFQDDKKREAVFDIISSLFGKGMGKVASKRMEKKDAEMAGSRSPLEEGIAGVSEGQVESHAEKGMKAVLQYLWGARSKGVQGRSEDVGTVRGDRELGVGTASSTGDQAGLSPELEASRPGRESPSLDVQAGSSPSSEPEGDRERRVGTAPSTGNQPGSSPSPEPEGGSRRGPRPPQWIPKPKTTDRPWYERISIRGGRSVGRVHFSELLSNARNEDERRALQELEKKYHNDLTLERLQTGEIIVEDHPGQSGFKLRDFSLHQEERGHLHQVPNHDQTLDTLHQVLDRVFVRRAVRPLNAPSN